MTLEDAAVCLSEPYIITATGQRFYFDRPGDFAYTVDDIAPALAKLARFTGHTERFLSVAEHAVLVSYLVPREHAYAALHHDDAEAFMGDISTPLKNKIPALRGLAASIEPHIAAALGFEYPFAREIHEADQIALGLEGRDEMPERKAWREIPPEFRDIKVAGLEWQSAEVAYRRRHEELVMGWVHAG